MGVFSFICSVLLVAFLFVHRHMKNKSERNFFLSLSFLTAICALVFLDEKLLYEYVHLLIRVFGTITSAVIER